MTLVHTGGATFGGVNFSVVQGGDGAVELDWDDNYATSVTPIPYSDDNYIQVGGREAVSRTLEALVTAANYSAMLAKRGQSATLVVHGKSRTALLSSIANKRRRPDDYLVCTLTFLA